MIKSADPGDTLLQCCGTVGVVIKNVNSGAKVLRSNPGTDTCYVVTIDK